MQNRKGSALVFIICIFFVFMMFSVIVTTMTTQAAVNASRQEGRIEAYYLVLSGIELGTSAVLAYGVDAEGQQYHKLLTEYGNDPVGKEQLTHYMGEAELGPGKELEIEVKAVWADGNNIIGGSGILPEDVWVQISVVGRVTRDTAVIEHAGKIRMLSTNPNMLIREIENPDMLPLL